jgi:hypothetical protein
MRTDTTVELSEGRLVVVKELRVKDVRKLLQFMTPEMTQASVPDLLRAHLPEIITFLGESLTLPEAESIDDLSLSECEKIGQAWWAIHKGFFLRLLAAQKQVAPVAPI